MAEKDALAEIEVVGPNVWRVNPSHQRRSFPPALLHDGDTFSLTHHYRHPHWTKGSFAHTVYVATDQAWWSMHYRMRLVGWLHWRIHLFVWRRWKIKLYDDAKVARRERERNNGKDVFHGNR